MGRRFVALFILTALIVSTLSCGQKKDSNLEFKVVTNKSFILPGSDTDCSGTTTSGPRLDFPLATINWKGDGDLYIAAISIRVKSGGGKLASDFSCEIGGKQLDGTWGLSVPGKIGTKGVYSNSCSIKCFGISVKKEVAFRLSGEAKLTAYAVDSAKNQKSYTSRTPIIVEYEP
jgi:hypothetical protein